MNSALIKARLALASRFSWILVLKKSFQLPIPTSTMEIQAYLRILELE